MNIWENFFKEGNIWGTKPSNSSVLASEFLKKNNVNNVLIPGVGYGRNASPFIEKGIKVTGIEISSLAIKLARQNSLTFPIINDSVLNLPLKNKLFDAIFCYNLLHLFNREKRVKILNFFFECLHPDGMMVIVVVSTKSTIYGNGEKIGHQYYHLENGLEVFFMMMTI